MINDTNTTSFLGGADAMQNVESLMTLTQAAQMLPLVRSTKINTSTLWRWCKHGLRGVYLEYRYLGRTIVTSPDALCRFFAALAQQDSKPMSPSVAGRRPLRPRTSLQRQRQIEEANTILVRAGILKPNAPADKTAIKRNSITKGML